MTEARTHKRLFFLGTPEDQSYIPRLKGCVGSAEVYVSTSPISTWFEVKSYCEKKGVTGIVSTSQVLLSKLAYDDPKPSINDYAGSFFTKDGLDIVFIDPLSHFVKVPYAKFLTSRTISKLINPSNWFAATDFHYTLCNESNIESLYDRFKNAFLIAVDSETFKNNLAIRCVGYTAFFYNPDGGIRSESCVIPLTNSFFLTWVRKFNWELQAPKVLQNGKYDCAYFARYNAPLYNYLFDTINAAHSWFVELPKDLGFITTFYVRNAWYWKNMSESNDLATYYEYCARDTWGTGNAFLAWLLSAPQWAIQNYLQEFPLVFPSHLCEMQGLKVDSQRFKEAQVKIESRITELNQKLDRMLGTKNFNVNSPIQMKKLLKVLGCGDMTSADEKHLAEASFRHPLNDHILRLIIGDPASSKFEDFGIRQLRKLLSTYLVEEKLFNGRILYAINPHGTDTGRNASREHHFWTGMQIQNIPRGPEVKQAICADEGFAMFESDLEQAESRDTAHIAGDEKLISAVTGPRDFHSVNASAFFGKKYEDIYDDSKSKTKDKPLRDLAKRVNHGANYNMGANVLVQTMGLKNIYAAARMLGLPRLYTPKQIAKYLLAQFHKTYPALQAIYYKGVVHDIETTKLLVGATGWTRYCFGDPANNKRDLNAYVAHAPQSLNAMVLNKAYLKVFYEFAINPNTRNNFRLFAQIHDSILFQCKVGHEDIAEKVKEAMEIPITVKGYDGRTRTFTVPAALKAGKDKKGAKYWSETE